MTPEQLMKPRFKVALNFPGNLFPIGSIIEADFENPDLWIIAELGLKSPELHDHPSKWPDVFKEMQWWEDRQLADNPIYVKPSERGLTFFHDKIYKVKHYSGKDCYDHLRLVDEQVGHAQWFLPATEEEYNAQQTS